MKKKNASENESTLYRKYTKENVLFFPNGITLLDFKCLECSEFFVVF